MGYTHSRFTRILEKIEAAVASLEFSKDQGALEILPLLHKAKQRAPQETPWVSDVLESCREALEAVAQESAPNRQDLEGYVAKAIRLVIQHLSNPTKEKERDTSVREISNQIRQSLNAGDSGHPVLPRSQSDPMNTNSILDDVAIRWVQLESNDLAGLTSVKEQLQEFVETPSLPETAANLVAQATKRIDEITQGTAQDPSQAFIEAGWFVEAAAAEIELYRSMSPQVAMAGVRQASPEIGEPRVGPTGSAASASAPIIDSSADQEACRLPEDTDLELTSLFLTESGEYIEAAEAALLSLETNPDDEEAVNTVFRAFHTIKGTSSFLGLTWITKLAHHAESLLSRIRDREIRCTGGYADLALASSDTLKELVQAVQNALGGQAMIMPSNYEDLMRTLENPEAAGVSNELNQDAVAAPRVGEILQLEGKLTADDASAADVYKGPGKIGVALVRSQSSSVTDVAHALRKQQRMKRVERGTESSVRVRTARLDRLIDMVGELVIAQSMTTQDATVVGGGHLDLTRKVAHTGKIVRELQDLSMSLRMVPLKSTFQKMNRLVRDLAHRCGKQVEFITQGEDTEIDRNMVDVVGDPLVHMIRNAVDHGIEAPEARIRAGKPQTGTVRLSAYHAGGNVVIELQDDGKGLNRGRILEKAISRGLVEQDKVLTDREVFNLIFAAGFSTAEEVTDISGRGVGMDVVKRDVESIRGQIDISSEVGQGSTFCLRLPLTLAITDGMLVKVGKERYIIPTVNIQLSLRPEAGSISTVSGQGELLMLRGELIPVFRLHRLFDVPGAVDEFASGLLVIVGEGDERAALLVDELLGQQQVVAKSLGEGIGNIPGVCGGAILGDGRVGLILDPSGIISAARSLHSGGRQGWAA